MSLNFKQLWRYQDRFIEGAGMTVALTVIAGVAGITIGVLGAILIRRGPRPVRWLIRAYVEIIRNTPSLIQIFLIFFVLPTVGLKFPPFEAAAVALSIYFGAYAIEIIRAGLDSIPTSQVEAGACLGLSRWEVFRHIVLAPALHNIYPAMTSQIVLLLLGTSIASQISAEELFHTGSFIDSRTFRSFEVYTVVCAIYFVLVMVFKGVFATVGRLAFRWPTRR